MADALYDVIAAGVPHRTAQVVIGNEAFAAFGLNEGCETVLPGAAAREISRAIEGNPVVEPGHALRLAAAIAAAGTRVAMLGSGPVPLLTDLNGLVADGVEIGQFADRSGSDQSIRMTVSTTRGARATAISYLSGDGASVRQASLLVRSARVLCLEDRLWDAEGGADYASRILKAARTGGRTTILVCKDAACVFRNSALIRQAAETLVDYVVGDAGVLLLLHGIQRFDSLVPRLRTMGANAILWRNGHEPLIVERAGAPWTGTEGVITAVQFWSDFLPACIGRIAATGSPRPVERSATTAPAPVRWAGLPPGP